MARIRTIKPEFWTDSVMVQLPFEARLLFIGLWNFADDEGRFPDEPERIKMQVFPSDPVPITALLDLLEAAGRLEYCDSDSGPYWLIPWFKKHQKIDHPSKSKFGEPSRKRAIPLALRRDLALKYGCAPGGEKQVQCYYCGTPGVIHWPKRRDGAPGYWVSFTLEIDHADSEVSGGEGKIGNLVLACRPCNRSKGFGDFSRFLANTREPARALAPEGKGMEGNGKTNMGDPPARPPSQPKVAPKPKPKTASKDGAYSNEFEAAMAALPKRSGNNPKREAYLCWQARLKEGVEWTAMLEGAKRYATWCNATGKAGTELVMQARRFFGVNRPYEQGFPVSEDVQKPATENQCIFINGKGRCPETKGLIACGSIIVDGKKINVSVCTRHHEPPVKNPDGHGLIENPKLREYRKRFWETVGEAAAT